MERAIGKAERLMQIEALLLEYPDGLSQAEISRRTGVNRSTIHRYLAELGHFSVYETDDGKLAIDRDHYLMNVRLTLHESMALHLAARLMATRTDKQNPHAAAALRKLGLALEKLAPRVAEHLKASADVMDDQARRHDPVYLHVLETLTRAWSDGRVARVWHRLEDGRVYDYDFAPYFIEPYAVGQTAHAIGWREPPGALRTFKLERIQRAELTDRAYTIPANFDPRALLADAWGIWYTEAEPVPVTLKFHPRVAGRVRETRWHRSEDLKEQPDGSLVWQAQVAEPREMLPWIRGWGADVEVVGPEELRETVMKEAQRMAKLYNVMTGEQNPQVDRLLKCWGKTRNGNDFHPALFHMLDVGHIAQILLSDPSGSRWRRILSKSLGTSPETLAGWLPYFVGAHDIGKVSAAFQGQVSAQRERLEAVGFPFAPWQRDLDVHHSVIGQVYAGEEQTGGPLSEDWRWVWRDVIGGHHGQFQPRQNLKEAQTSLECYEPPPWKEMRLTTDQLLRQHFLKTTPPLGFPPNPATATVALTGFTILCDWLGSDEQFFSPAADFDLGVYAKISRDRAQRALKKAGFLQSTYSKVPATFADLFPDKPTLRPLQAAVDAVPQEVLNGPCLVIIEAPTGEGKTEAALTLAHRLAQTSGTDALYYALPTTATSNQMYGRVQKYLSERLKLPGDVRLIHGQAHLLQDDLNPAPLRNNERETPADMVEWFTSKKRAILAPFGVGTVDQVELAALNVKHSALRLFGLAGKVVIFDEVHAYDTYMTTIVETLLQWLAALDASVIILSATLPQGQRAALAHAYGVDLPENAEQSQAYPSLWILRPGLAPYHAAPPACQPGRRLQVRALHFKEEASAEKARWLLDAVVNGGCACWITNTVGRAQEIFDYLRRLTPEGIDLTLLHARLPLEDRQRQELLLAHKYGPVGDRPRRGIVVGTQVLEQSLDLDFDVMVSDLAPIDLLLQRAGRLQRHGRPRPAAFAVAPTLWINAPIAPDGTPDLDIDTVVYAEFLLRQTWRALPGCQEILLPRDYRPLVEAVYGITDLAADDALKGAWEKLQHKRSDAVKEAKMRLIPEVDAGPAFCRRIAKMAFEEDETSVGWIVAQTRLGQASVNVIPLERDGAVARLIPSDETVALDHPASREVQFCLLQRQIRTSRSEIIKAVKAEPLPKLFTQSARLRGYYPLWLTNGRTEVPSGKAKLIVTLDPDLGLTIRTEKGA